MNSDFRDLLLEFNAAGVEFLVVGAHALAAHGHVFGTVKVPVVSRHHLIANKRASGRLQDLADIERLGG